VNDVKTLNPSNFLSKAKKKLLSSLLNGASTWKWWKKLFIVTRTKNESCNLITSRCEWNFKIFLTLQCCKKSKSQWTFKIEIAAVLWRFFDVRKFMVARGNLTVILSAFDFLWRLQRYIFKLTLAKLFLCWVFFLPHFWTVKIRRKKIFPVNELRIELILSYIIVWFYFWMY